MDPAVVAAVTERWARLGLPARRPAIYDVDIGYRNV